MWLKPFNVPCHMALKLGFAVEIPRLKTMQKERKEYGFFKGDFRR
nr:MAG TPA: hypothetical protein [Caudoviricetes sp.]